MESIANKIEGKEVLITGGLGMIGSTIAGKLVAFGAHVTIMDACIEPYGANFFNVDEIKNIITLNISDIRDKESMKVLVQGKDIVFNLAAQVSHNDSIEQPFLRASITLDISMYLKPSENIIQTQSFYFPVLVFSLAGMKKFLSVKTIP